MQFDLTDDQREITEVARRFTASEIKPHAAHWTRPTFFPVETIRAAAGLGFGAIYGSEASGGIGLDRIEAALIMEAMAYGCPSTSALEVGRPKRIDHPARHVVDRDERGTAWRYATASRFAAGATIFLTADRWLRRLRVRPALSSIASASSRFSFPFSSSSAHSRFASDTSRPPNFAFQA